MHAKQEAGRFIPNERPSGASSAFLLAAGGGLHAAPLHGGPDARAGLGPAPRELGQEDERPRRPFEGLEAQRAIEPLLRVFASPALAAPAEPSPPAQLPAALDPSLLKLLRRVAWGGDAQRSLVLLEFGSGALAGARLTVVSQRGAVSLELELPPGTAAGDWEERLSGRLLRRGVPLESVRVR